MTRRINGRTFLHVNFVLITCAIIIIDATKAETQTENDPPVSRRQTVRDILHGVEIIDDYRWLEDQQSPETRAWINDQNSYSHSHLDGLSFRPDIKERLATLMAVDQVGRPYERRGRFFVWKKLASDDLWTLFWRDGLDGKDNVLVDPHGLSDDHTTSITLEDISEDGTLVAYGVRRGGEDEIEIWIKDVASGDVLPDRLPRGLYNNFDFANDNSGFYYAARDRTTGTRVRYHEMGGSPAEDIEIFGEGFHPDMWISAWLSGSGRYLLFYVAHGWASSEIYFKDVKNNGPVRAVATGMDASFEPGTAGDRLVIQTDWQAPNRRIMAVDLDKPDRIDWKEIVPEGSNSIESFSLAGGRLFVHTLHNVTSRIEMFDLDGRSLGKLKLPGMGSASEPRGRWESNTAFYGFESFTTPWTVYHYDIPSGATEPWMNDAIPFDGSGFDVKQVWYESKDGIQVPMFLVHKTGLELNGRQPTLLYGYGGFNVSLTPRFRPMWAVWVERGGVFALANLRGGGEFGEAWHKAGMLDKKQNVFDDFIAAAEWLIDNNYTMSQKLAIQGGSNGGLLVGAAMTQRPELYRAVLCQFPDLDMVRYYQFENNNPPALAEYGDASNPEHFEFLRKYSPYQNVRTGTKYPAVLLTTGDADTRVPPLQARKMTAVLQHATASDHPIFLLYDEKAGHAGGVPFKKRVDDLSLELAFLCWQLGVDSP
jgi:prolyl oligopeptidase